jgi:hypothetical protein
MLQLGEHPCAAPCKMLQDFPQLINTKPINRHRRQAGEHLVQVLVSCESFATAPNAGHSGIDGNAHCTVDSTQGPLLFFAQFLTDDG